ncbi:uncharacterized protein LOC119828740 [Zerene cesonia]|uniref:uncharacterized protein LOC119828740 n=1 Tax=Zerene cesonia TaxID=33412 RepID=UPI0018E54626|nr:uncharacterized protein LOC119828740 [Zerene cesonia]
MATYLFIPEPETNRHFHVVNQNLLSVSGTAVLASTDGSAKFTVSIGTNPQVSYWILGTDYEEYALAYSCQNVDSNQQEVFSWKLSRSSALDVESNNKINSIISSISSPVLDNNLFENADQSDAACFYYPNIPQNEPVIFPGQCDPNINVVSSLNLTEFQGEWVLIQTYYSERQSGTCNRAEYTATGNGLTVVNSHVVNQNRLSVSGTATSPASDGKLVVNIGSNPAVNYWILGTNYETYALAYSCENIDSNRRRVWSWKLSRTTSLRDEDAQAINSLMSNVDVLDQRYFQNADQSDAACFYYPNIPQNEPVIFPGQCDPNINVVSSLNLTEFQGEWVLIQTYYSERQSGTCNRAEYTATGNGLTVVNSHVVNQNRLSVSGTATSPAGDGKLVVNIGSNPAVNYWILGTNYETYALAYSCENIDSNRRRVWSWKLSRTTSLRDEDAQAINSLMSNVDVLDQRYFQNADQSDAACFYYPDIPQGEPVIFPGQCDPNINVVSSLNLTEFQGEWVLIQTYFSERQSGTCNRAQYGLNGNVLSVVNSHVVNQNLLSVSGTATSPSGDGKLVVNIGSNPAVNYWILGTNYDTYALAYSCQNLENNRRRVWSWKLSRTTSLRDEDAQAINNLMSNVDVLDQRYFQNADQSDAACFYYPDIPQGEPVIFPGQCDPNINVVSSLNLTEFQGEWVLIQTYFSERQSGTCNRAEYALNGNVLSVVNSHVVNQNRLSVSGTATSPSGDGKLVVNIGSNPAVNYWILGTNYDTYALAYSCQNLENNRRRVWSWKLSRTTSLRDEDAQAINSLMSNVDVLDQRYFQNADQSDAACFYYPDIPLGEPVIFPGQCDPNINVVSSLNLTEFQGEWVLIQTYFSERQSGTCNRAQYGLSGNVLSVVNSHVVNQNLLSVSGTATSPSGDGKLVVNIGSNPAVNYWILGTNYDTYALAYSCQNLENNRRRVWSWKLSRTTSLRDEDAQAINSLMSNVDVLDQRYFQNADQSDAACFYYPDIPQGEPVIFPGQCDPNINVVNSLNLTEFQGEWVLIQTYFSERQSGTCNRAQYGLNGNVLSVVNSHVVNQNLLSVSGTATSPSGDGKLVVNIGSNPAVNYWILGTNYDTYALAYSCQNLENNRRRVWSWKLSRTTSLRDEDAQAINNLMSNVDVLDQRYFQNADQSDAACFYYPDIPLGEPVIFPGQCDPNINVVSSLNLTEFQGEWVLIQTYFSERQSGTCNRAQYGLNGNVLSVVNSHVVNQNLLSVSGTATSPSGDGKLVVNIGSNPAVNYWILGTNYETYALAYSCQNLENNRRRVWSWKLSRTTSLRDEDAQAINSLMSNVDVLDQRYFQNADQSDAACFYYPDIPQGDPVIFPGQCDPNINVVSSLNLTEFQGEWVLIQTYFSERQSGTCNRAQYGLNGNVLSVVNSHVVNQNLLSVSGTATSPSGDGKLVVNIGSNPAVNYWILGTNYDTYALAYSCQNLENNRRRVWSWKLSRTTSLRDEDAQAINNLMSNVDVLDQRYFQNADQSDAACFYYPDIPLGEPVIFPGQCDPNINVVSSLNLTEFQGEWVLIQTYFSERQSGTCNRAQYGLNGNVLSVVNSHVVNQNLLSVSGTATSPSGDGKLVVNIGSNPAVNYWILGTNYDTYALAYSCQNLENNRRRVWSWKLSRTTSLRDEDAQAINSLMSNVDVLDQRYFQNADQSDAACFYYPDIPLGEPVIFSGQCDPNINVVSSLNLTEFQGEWILIQTYFSERQSGTCNRAEYTLNGNVLSVVNSHVVNQNLLSVSGTATSPTGDGKLIVNIGSNPAVDYWILGTNYNSYALAYSCQNLENNRRRVWSWKLSRTTSLRDEDAQVIDSLMSDVNVLDQRYYQNADQSDAACYYSNDISLGEPVIFPGQCDPNISVVSNLNLTEFQGEWVLIQTYFSERQSGTCNRAQYALSGNGLTVVNSHVVNQNRLSVSGTATSPSGDGKLVVNIGSNPAVDYWILGTNYESYALAYSCQNLDNNRQRVWSWKLSRTTSLRDEDAQAINSLMSNVDVLDQRYFQNADQSDAACFYYPEFEPNEPVVFPGQCDVNVPVVSNFNVSRFQNEWVLISSYYSARQSGSCNRAKYTLDGSVLNVVNSHVVNETLLSVSGTATVVSSGKLVVNIGSNPPADYWILDTDYDNYALAYSCENINNAQRRIWSWKLSRTTYLTSEANQNIESVMSNIDVLDNRYFQYADQSDSACFYLPDIPLGEAVIFPGQCDPNIAVVSNFNMTAFLGDWRLISTYYTHRQSGTCNMASYSFSGNTIRVVNSHIVNQNHMSVSGTVVLASTDGSGKLNVSISRRTVDYWILTTDYENYALAYSCSNLQNNQRRVYSWKLSRSRTMSAPGNTAIDNVINNVNVLNERYFENANQTDAGCFYFPRVNPDAPVIFPGQCDLGVRAVYNFNVSAFLGVWHEIEIYPTGLDNEQCATQDYIQQSATSFTLAARYVNNGVQGSYNWLLERSASDTTGSFIATIQTPSMSISFPFWIIDTDYNNYALAYACANMDAYSRRVYSWKLSRSKQLSAASNAAITSSMENIQVLDQRYFKTLNQSDAACFHLPEFGEGQTVVLPGQCDVNIPVVADFDVEKYSGTWYQIERYPQRFESGDCTGARYTLNGDVVTLLNWQRIDGVLDTIEGNATIISTDGSAKLRVTLPSRAPNASPNQVSTMDLYVLTTDYNTYSLAYSCVNVDAHHRALGAWKLSRSRTMSADGNNAINAYMANRQELENRYFIRVEQNDSCPEPSSAIIYKSSITVLFILCLALFNIS